MNDIECVLLLVCISLGHMAMTWKTIFRHSFVRSLFSGYNLFLKVCVHLLNKWANGGFDERTQGNTHYLAANLEQIVFSFVCLYFDNLSRVCMCVCMLLRHRYSVCSHCGCALSLCLSMVIYMLLWIVIKALWF